MKASPVIQWRTVASAHPNAEIAIRRALVELAQPGALTFRPFGKTFSRRAPSQSTSRCTPRISTINRNSWYFGRSKHLRKLSDVPSYPFATIEEDLHFLVQRFASCGLHQIIVIDFTLNLTTHSVVRVIVPGIESWALDRTLGPRAVEFWKQNV
jgi:ribosomal protein S12 methylthiotransferase accessory factor